MIPILPLQGSEGPIFTTTTQSCPSGMLYNLTSGVCIQPYVHPQPNQFITIIAIGAIIALFIVTWLAERDEKAFRKFGSKRHP
jgi:hypothetical protein